MVEVTTPKVETLVVEIPTPLVAALFAEVTTPSLQDFCVCVCWVVVASVAMESWVRTSVVPFELKQVALSSETPSSFGD